MNKVPHHDMEKCVIEYSIVNNKTSRGTQVELKRPFTNCYCLLRSIRRMLKPNSFEHISQGLQTLRGYYTFLLSELVFQIVFYLVLTSLLDNKCFEFILFASISASSILI